MFPAVLRALRKITPEQLAMYPEYEASTKRLARHFAVRPSEMLLTNGVDDALRLLMETFVEPGSTVLVRAHFPCTGFSPKSRAHK